jgi:hypothetical protein
MKARAQIFVLVAVVAPSLRASADDGDPGHYEDARYETVVLAPAAAEAGQAHVAEQDLRQAPGAQGDVGKAVQNLPGVARAALAGGELVLWGAPAEESRVVFDGIEIPALYHQSGLRSTVNSALVRSLALIPGGYGAGFGRGLGGLVRIESTAPAFESYRAEANVDVLDASLMASAALGRGAGLIVAGRFGYLDRIFDSALSESTRRIFPLPRYHDFQAKVSIPLRDEEKVDLIVLGSSDASAIANSGVSPSVAASENRDSSFYRVGARYVRFLPDGSGATVTPFVGWDRSTFRRSAGLGGVDQSSSATMVGLRASYDVVFSPALVLTLGVDGLLTWSTLARTGSATLPAREGDIAVFGQPLSGGASTDTWHTATGNLAPYASVEIVHGRWRVVPSFRLDGDLVSTDRSSPATGTSPRVGTTQLPWSPAPRLAISRQALSWLRADLALGLYNQAPAAADLSAVFGTPTLGTMHAMHAVLGAAANIGDKLGFEPSLFYRRLWDLVLRNPNPSPPLAHALVQDGVGRVYGAQALLRFSPVPAFSGWIAYTISRSERRHDSDACYRLLDQDQTHLLTAVANARWRGFTLGTRFRLATGAPRTPVVSSYMDTTTGQFQPVFGAQNSIRLPVFYALDARLEKRFAMHALEVSPYLEILNLTNHGNVEELTYDETFSAPKNITGLPILAVAGVAVRL